MLRFKTNFRLDCRVVFTYLYDNNFILRFNDRYTVRPIRIQDGSEDYRNSSISQVLSVGHVLLHNFSLRFCHVLGEGRPGRNELVQEILHID
jgi:hypothetical protein